MRSIVGAWMLAAAAAHAGSGDLLTYVGVQSDEQGGLGGYGGVNYAFSAATSGSLSAGYNHADIDTRNVAVALDHTFNELVTVGASVGYFGDADEIDTTTWRGNVTLRPGALRLSLLAERRSTDVTLEVLVPGTLRVQAVDRSDHADGYGARLGFDFDNGLWLSCERMQYDHSLDLKALNQQIARANRFLDSLGRDASLADLGAIERRIGGALVVSSSSIANSNSLLDHASTFSVGYANARFRLGADYAADESAVDGAALDTWTGVFALSLGGQSEIELAVGHTAVDGGNGALFAGLTWFHYR